MICRRSIAAGILLAGSLVLSATRAAQAGVVTFDDIIIAGNNPVQTAVASGGFDFTGPHFHIINTPTFCGLGGCVSNGTQFAAIDAPLIFSPSLGQPVTMTRTGGGVFALKGFEGAEGFLDDAAAATAGYAAATYIHVVGNVFGGGTISADFTLDGLKDGAGGVVDFQPFLFDASWTNLTSAIWSGLTPAGAPAGLAFDNIVVEAPEPATLTLFSIGLAGALTTRRRKRKTA